MTEEIIGGDSVMEAQLSFQIESGGSNPTSPLHPRIDLLECATEINNKWFRTIINKYHSYMDYKDTCNRRINWLVFIDGKLSGAIGINNAILALSARDKWIGWDKEQRLKHLNNIANNYRFAMMERGFGSKVLSRLCKIAPKLWADRYGDILVLLESLVLPPWQGIVYKASNWIYVGQTKGFSFSKAPLASWQKENGKRGELARLNPEAAIAKYAVGHQHYAVKASQPKLVFIKPLCKDWKGYLGVVNP